MQIIPGVYQIKLPASSLYLIAEPDGLTLIDAGTRRAVKPVLAFIRSLGEDPARLRRILITHADFDHIGAAKALKDLTGARICAHQIAAAALAQGVSSRPIHLGVIGALGDRITQASGSMCLQVDEIFLGGEVLPVLGGMQVLHVPGHTPCHLAYYAPAHKLLFAGDAVSTRGDRVLYNRMRIFNWDEDKMRASVHILENLQPQIVCSGHGPVVFDAARKFPSSNV